eukprot:CAMPEP_0202820428 /NCGR_PEP_ID=MMETSP1389-20130828/9728_1 /ASSEMBLY_ACC=CAM_ASM_000865 /TAXON_ID=302021 /ORGANISM="Rhodomonas sp., Strain CCMP768" /LENGTH=133 /DNA_ID=CAMNT_0049493101 /DNA_START=62 /DNA_END=459 /DNA_ORIENTATION=+
MVGGAASSLAEMLLEDRADNLHGVATVQVALRTTQEILHLAGCCGGLDAEERVDHAGGHRLPLLGLWGKVHEEGSDLVDVALHLAMELRERWCQVVHHVLRVLESLDVSLENRCVHVESVARVNGLFHRLNQL